MEYRFNAAEWESIPVAERVRRCRLMADEALKLAEKAAPELKAYYLRLANEWQKLAREMERKSR